MRRIHWLAEDVEMIYQAYPRKVGHRAALREIVGALNRIAKRGGDVHPVLFLLLRVQKFAASPAGQAGDKTPHPRTWFHQDRFDDDTGTWYDRRPGCAGLGSADHGTWEQIRERVC